jgi:RF-1 domain
VDHGSTPNPHPAALAPEELLRHCTQRYVRRSGPGGQNRNKVETGVVLTHVPSGITAEASERRSQAENRAIAVRRLRRSLALEIRLPRPASEPSRLWQSRVRQGRILLSEEHDDHPAMLAEALDTLAVAGWDAGAAAEQLGVTASQLVKLLKTEPRALKLLNDEREVRGLSPLR